MARKPENSTIVWIVVILDVRSDEERRVDDRGYIQYVPKRRVKGFVTYDGMVRHIMRQKNISEKTDIYRVNLESLKVGKMTYEEVLIHGDTER